MSTRTMGWAFGVAGVIGALASVVGCDDTKKDAAQTVAAQATASAAPSVAPTPAAEAPPAGCKAPADKPMQLGEVHGDVYGFVGDATHIYYSTWQLYGSRGDLGKFRKDGQGGQPLTSLRLEPRGMALDEKTVYYTSGIRLNTIAKEGGKEGTIDEKFSSQSIAADGANIYGVPGNYGPYDRVATVPKTGGASKELASVKRPTVKEGLNGYSAIGVDAGGIYVTDSGNGKLLKFPLAGGKPTPLATGLKKPFWLALDDANVYFSVAAGDLMVVPKAGGKAKKLASGLVEEAHIAGDSKAVYAPFKGTGDGVVMDKIDVSDGSTKPIASVGSGHTVTAVSLDDTCVYWVERVDAGKSFVFALAR